MTTIYPVSINYIIYIVFLCKVMLPYVCIELKIFFYFPREQVWEHLALIKKGLLLHNCLNLKTEPHSNVSSLHRVIS